MTPQKVAEQFVTAINVHDVESLASLMTSDHRFIDSLGAVVEGRDSMRDGWKFYFAMVSEPRNEGSQGMRVRAYYLHSEMFFSRLIVRAVALTTVVAAVNQYQ